MSKDLSNVRIELVTHYRIYSAAQALRDWLRANNCSRLLYISHPLPLADIKSSEPSYCEESRGGAVVIKKEADRVFENLVKSSITDTRLALKWCFSFGRGDLFIGVDNLNAFAGLILKRLGRVEKVVYYTIDYFPVRFENKILNKIYHFIDKVCVKYADETWNVSSVMVSAREKYNKMNPRVYNRQHTVPIGIWYDTAPRKKFEKIDKKKLVFAGHLLPHMGVDLVIRSLPKIIDAIPDIRLEIVGGGQEEKSLQKLAKELKVGEYIKFLGWVRDRKKFEEILSTGVVGLATFNTDILDDKVKNADPGKIKDYMLLGMPVIVTDAISNAGDIEKAKCGIVIRYRISDLVSAVVKLLEDPRRLAEYRENALKYVRQFDYNKIFEKNVLRVLYGA